jgi:hypothetical protein
MSQTLVPNNAAFVLQPAGVIPAVALDKTFQAADTVNGNSFLSSGRDLLIVYNSDSSSHTFTIFSAPDPNGRFANVTYTVGAGVYSFIEIDASSIYVQPSTNLVLLAASDPTIKYLVVLNA